MKSAVNPQLYKDVFEIDKRGEAILEDLIARFSRPAVTKGGIDAVLQTYHREGAREVVEFIVSRINQAHGVINHADEDENQV